MSHSFCFKLNDGTEICIPILQVRLDRIPLPDPPPWMEAISILDTVSELAGRLADVELQRPLLEAAAAGIDALAAQLPPGMELHRSEVFANA